MISKLYDVGNDHKKLPVVLPKHDFTPEAIIDLF